LWFIFEFCQFYYIDRDTKRQIQLPIKEIVFQRLAPKGPQYLGSIGGMMTWLPVYKSNQSIESFDFHVN